MKHSGTAALDPVWNILMVDDDEDDYLLVQSMLREARPGNYQLVWADSYKAGLQALPQAAYDAILLDYHLGQCNGLGLIAEAAALGCKAPFIVLTNSDPRDVEELALKNGATLYLPKNGLTPRLLELGLRHVIFTRQCEQETLERSNTAALAERQHFTSLLDAMPVYLILLTSDYRVKFDNLFFRQRFGEHQGRRCYEYLFNVDSPCEKCDTYKVLQTQTAIQWEWTGPDGHTYDIHDFPYTDSDGENLIMEVGIDITPRKRILAELEHHRQHLEELVAERTRTLESVNVMLLDEIAERKRAQDVLVTYAEQLKTSNQALEDFAFVASHDLQEPLRKIKGFGNQLKSHYGQVLDEQALGFIDRMDTASDRMQGMLNGLLAYSRVTTQDSQCELVDLHQVAQEVVYDLEIRVRQTGGQVQVDELPAVEADPLQMRQLFQNLISNALKFHRQDCAPMVVVSGKTLPTGMVEIAVQDNGIGFDIQQAALLFKPFHQLHGRNQYGGHGMGLAICKKIVERYGGKITVESAPDQGSTFTVTLPASLDRK